MAVPVIDAIIFDCFGVLYTDSKRSLLDVVPPQRRRLLDDLFRANNYGLYDRDTYLEQVAEIAGMSVAEVSEYIAHEHQLNRALAAYISEKLKPHYQIGMLSNIGRDWIESFFSEHQLHELFDQVVLSGEEGIVKPDPEIYLRTAQRLGVKPENCVMIDDIAQNCDGAVQAGMFGIQFLSTDQALADLGMLIEKKDY